MSAVRRGVVAVLVVFGVVVVGALPADAHAVLLRTTPSPQSTVAEAPTSVRLEFSEPVETAFGAVRVFDVDGHRVDRGAVARAPGHRVLTVPLKPLKDGTYTVTWRVVSADGHQVHGGFVFYVGAPSTISPVAIAGDTGAGRTIGWGFGVARFVWFSALIAIVGLVVARRFVWTPSLREAELSDSPVADGFRRRFSRALPAAWVTLLVAGAVAIVFQAASVSGLSLREALSGDVIGDVLRTTYGRAWSAQMVLAALMVLPVLALAPRRRVVGGSPSLWLVVLGLLSVGLAFTAAISGHARTDPNPALAVSSIVVHLIAVGCWVGGLAALVSMGGLGWRAVPADQRASFLARLVHRFSGVALIAVAVVVVTGTINSVTAMAGVSDLWQTEYGKVVATKVVLLAAALVLAARHRRAPRTLTGEDAERATRSFARTSAVELGLLVGAVALASALVALVPGRSLALAERGPLSTERAVGPYTLQLFIDPTAVGPNQIHATFVDASGLAAAEVTNATVRVTPPGGTARAVAMRLIAPGHFAGDVTFARPGTYRLSVSTTADGRPVATQFTFKISRRD